MTFDHPLAGACYQLTCPAAASLVLRPVRTGRCRRLRQGQMRLLRAKHRHLQGWYGRRRLCQHVFTLTYALDNFSRACQRATSILYLSAIETHLRMSTLSTVLAFYSG